MSDVLRDAGGTLHAPAGTRCVRPCVLVIPRSTDVGATWYGRCTAQTRASAVRFHMSLHRSVVTVLVPALTMVAGSSLHGRAGAETFTATATVKMEGGTTASAPITIVVDRKVSSAEADGVAAA